MIWSIDLDDFSGYCSNITYPLTKSILANLKTIDRKKCDSLPRIEDPGQLLNFYLKSMCIIIDVFNYKKIL
jgi:hypothetical protein